MGEKGPNRNETRSQTTKENPPRKQIDSNTATAIGNTAIKGSGKR
jgi:hypothetical protein